MSTRHQSGLSDHDCYAVLGLPPGAKPDEVDAAYAELQRILSRARQAPELQGWAERQRDMAERAYLSLTAPRPAPSRRVPTGHGRMAASAAARRRWRGRRRAFRRGAGWPAWLTRAWRGVPEQSRAIVLAIVSGVVTLAVFLAVQQVWPGQQTGPSRSTAVAPTPAAPAEQFVPLDQSRVTELQARVERDAKDAEALFELGERHFQAGKWQETIDWFTRLLVIDPNHVHAQTDIGTAQYNLGRFAEARTAWTQAQALAPDDAQLHYNLGFLYANGQPRDLDAAKREWALVIKVAPESELATQARRDLDALQQRQSQPLAPRPSP